MLTCREGSGQALSAQRENAPPTPHEEATLRSLGHRTAPRVLARRPSGSPRASRQPRRTACRPAGQPRRPPRPGSPPAGDPSATFPPEEGHGGARVGAEGAGGLSRGGPSSPHSAAGRDFRVRRRGRTSPKISPSSGCGRRRLLEMPGQLPPCYQQATRLEFRPSARGASREGPAPPPPARLLPRGRGARPRNPRDPASLQPRGPVRCVLSLSLLFGKPGQALPRRLFTEFSKLL